MSSSPRIFITGVSGYLGGHLLVRLVEQHPSWNIVALVRNEAQKEKVLARWPGSNIEILIGDLDDKALLVQEGAKADVILQTASADHIPGVLALIEGASHRPGHPAYLIHVGGTGMLNDVPSGFGQPSDKVYHDVADLEAITSFAVENHVHRDVDMALLQAQKAFHVPTAIVSPPTIHGVGKGPIKTRSIQIPLLAEAVLKRGKGFQILEGQNLWDAIHVDDVVAAFLLLSEEALKSNGGNAQWGQEGYYFVEAEEFKWGDISSAVAKTAFEQGFIKTADIEKLSVQEASTLHPWAPLIWGGNARSRADRLYTLGWKPQGPGIYDSLPSTVTEEAKTLGIQGQRLTFDK